MRKTTILNPFSHIVYVMWGHKCECLYVGRSKHGLARFAKDHKMWLHREEIHSVDIYTLKSIESTVRLERRMTKLLSPKYDESHLSGWSRFGRKRHADRVSSLPEWASDYEKICVVLDRCWPRPGPGRNRAFRIISMYHQDGALLGQIAHELDMSVKAVQMVLSRIAKATSRPAKPRGRPRKTRVMIGTPSGTQGDDSHTSL